MFTYGADRAHTGTRISHKMCSEQSKVDVEFFGEEKQKVGDKFQASAASTKYLNLMFLEDSFAAVRLSSNCRISKEFHNVPPVWGKDKSRPFLKKGLLT